MATLDGVTILTTTNYATGNRYVAGLIDGSGTYSGTIGKGIPVTAAALGLQNIQLMWVGSPNPTALDLFHTCVAVLEPHYSTDGTQLANWMVKFYSSAGTEYAIGTDTAGVEAMSFFAIGSSD
jgi:hypothetical protein